MGKPAHIDLPYDNVMKMAATPAAYHHDTHFAAHQLPGSMPLIAGHKPNKKSSGGKQGHAKKPKSPWQKLAKKGRKHATAAGLGWLAGCFVGSAVDKLASGDDDDADVEYNLEDDTINTVVTADAAGDAADEASGLSWVSGIVSSIFGGSSSSSSSSTSSD